MLHSQLFFGFKNPSTLSLLTLPWQAVPGFPAAGCLTFASISAGCGEGADFKPQPGAGNSQTLALPLPSGRYYQLNQ